MASEFRISAVIPTYNRARLLVEAIESVFAQTYPAWEIIVVDDGSTDETQEVLREYGPRVRVIRQENGGEAAGRNTGMLAATGDWVAFLDSDDCWLPQKLEWQVAALSAYPQASVCYCEDGQLNPKTLLTTPPRIVAPRPRHALYRQLLDRSLVGISTVVMRRTLIEQVGCFDTALHWGVDWEYLSRLALACDFVELEDTLVYYRLHGGNITGNLDLRVRNGIQAVKKIYSVPAARPYRRNQAKKISEIIADAGIELFYSGRHGAARRLLWRAIEASPGNGAAWSYFGKSLLPAGWLRALRIARHGAAAS